MLPDNQVDSFLSSSYLCQQCQGVTSIDLLALTRCFPCPDRTHFLPRLVHFCRQKHIQQRVDRPTPADPVPTVS